MRIRSRIGKNGDNFIVYWLSLVIAGLVVLVNHLSYGADGDFYLNFPVHGYNSSNAPISSIFDHSVKDAVKGDDGIWRNGTITAFTGDTGFKEWGVCTDDCYMQKSQENFVLKGVNYTGTTECGQNYLCYDGHNGIDYRYDYGTALYPAISGTVTYPLTKEAYPYHGLMIESEDGNYRVYYLHLSSWFDRTTGKMMRKNSDGSETECTDCAKEGEWVERDRSNPVGYVGDYSNGWGGVSAHLHISVKKRISNNNYVNVDPYLWVGSGSDPYEEAKGVKSVDLWTAPSNNITHTLTTPSKTTVSRGSLLARPSQFEG